MSMLHVPQSDIDRQYEFAGKIRDICSGKRYFIVTLGCQMNVRDSETLAGWLEKSGYLPSDTREEADIIIYNTCCVRENAENKALGNVIWLKEIKKDKPELIIAVCGCMMQGSCKECCPGKRPARGCQSPRAPGPCMKGGVLPSEEHCT